jgi:hypothetical protein
MNKKEYHLYLQCNTPGAPEVHITGTLDDARDARLAGYTVEVGRETTPENTREPITYGGDLADSF